MYSLNTCFYIALKSSHSFYVLCIIVNLCLFTDKYIFIFIFRRYCNKNNTFPNVGHTVPLKISFNSSPGCDFFFLLLHCCRQSTQTNKRYTMPSGFVLFFFSLLFCLCLVNIQCSNPPPPTLWFWGIWNTDFFL